MNHLLSWPIPINGEASDLEAFTGMRNEILITFYSPSQLAGDMYTTDNMFRGIRTECTRISYHHISEILFFRITFISIGPARSAEE